MICKGAVPIKKNFIIIGAFLAVFTMAFLIYKENFNAADEVYLIPESYEGCVKVIYDIEEASALPLENNTITYDIPADGMLKTSSPSDLGWAYEDHSGFRNVDYYYVEDSGERTEINSEEKIHGAGLGGTERTMPDGSAGKLTYSHFFVGTDQPRTENCFLSTQEIQELLNK